MMRFRDFIEADMASAPAMGQSSGAPTSPGGGSEPTKPGKNDMRVGWREFDIDPEDGEEAIKHGEPIMSYEPLKVGNHPFNVSGPEPITFDKDGNPVAMYSVMNKNKMTTRGDSKLHYTGPVKDMRLPLGNRNRPDRKNLSLDDIILSPWQKSQQGGAPPGSVPPGGAPPGAPGAPPMGGM